MAASYEAKSFGVKTGTLVRDAKALCPHIVLLPSRHRLYVQYNLQIAALLDRMAEVERIRSIDEFQIRLSGVSTELSGAFELVSQMKAALAREIGPAIRFSAGIGSNALLAKLAGKLRKPDGCEWLSPRNMPDRIAHLKLDDLAGISKGIKAKLYKARVWDVPALYQLDPRHARLIWGSIEGERFVRALQGEDVPLVESERHGYGNSKVLAPESRPISQAYLVSRWLTEKACARLRRDGRVASSFCLSVRFLPEGGGALRLKCEASQDTGYFLKLHRQLWERLWRAYRPSAAIAVSVQLGNVSFLKDRAGDLFSPVGPAERTEGEKVSSVVDQINSRFGKDTVSWGVNKPHYGFFERG